MPKSAVKEHKPKSKPETPSEKKPAQTSIPHTRVLLPQKSWAGRHKELGVTEERMREMLYWMKLTRAFDDRIEQMHKQSKIVGGAFSSLGQEGATVACAIHLKKEDVCAPMIRNLACYLMKGMNAKMLMTNYCGRTGTPTDGRDGNVHVGSLDYGLFGPVSHLGTSMAICAGASLAFQMKKTDQIGMTFIGDGASSIGDFHETINLAAVWNLPFVCFIEHNGYAYSTPTAKQTLTANLADKAAAYGLPSSICDGNDVLDTYEKAKDAVDRARSGGGPTLVEIKTYRRRGHAIHDDQRYVPKEEMELWVARDPIKLFSEYILEAGIMSEKDIKSLDAKVLAEIDEAEEYGLAQPYPEGKIAAERVFAD
ncbi:MAG: thiamine pyrophosphate-dependent dehydrogenase E1 component subunit alpha [Planctomycetes bacterium]|nr:thiamine pyrophosphate-dependent dehydrogenase E1 component subunit alpha [Planctomycetota bacterium]